MPNASFVQTDFRGGVWSNSSQGRMTDERYKTALNTCYNAVPTEQGGWQRRPGSRLISITRKGRAANLKSFRFSREQPYQIEFTGLKARFIVGLDLVRDATTESYIFDITADTPAVVKMTSDPGWSVGDTVIVDVDISSTTEMPTTYALFGRQLEIKTYDAATMSFTIKDPVTGADIDGSTINYIPRTTADRVRRILEVASPYLEADLPYIRAVNTTEEVIFLCKPPGSIGYKPYTLAESGTSQFTLAISDFINGPYLDEPYDLIEKFNNDLVLSAVTGSVTITADTTVGINDGDGFQSTDVGRLIWLQTGPPSWDSGVTYPKKYVVLGSDNNIYKSIKSGNINHDPTTDNATYWEITSETVVATWAKITGVTSTKIVSALIKGDDAKSVSPTRHWRLGVYSDTTGYPSCGAFHENRLILCGAVKNRLDGSRNYRTFNFAPTEIDGTVSDDDAVGATLSNRDAEEIAWALSTDDGLIVGSLAGEWKVAASNLDDPLTPTSMQSRNLSTSGSAAIEPVFVYGAPYSIQASQRKLVAHHKNYYGRFETINLSEKAEGLMTPYIKDLAWVQEPLLSFFLLRSDGTLASCIHRKAVSQEEFTGWAEHEHALLRDFEAIAYGPSFTGTSDTLYTVTWDGVEGHPRWLETMMPAFVTSDSPWKAWHTDASSPGYYIRRMVLANGDSFDGVRVFVSWYLNGITVHPFIGGMDLGDFVVTNGYVDIPFTTTFTAAYLASVSDGTDYSDWGVHLTWSDAPVTTLPDFPLNTIIVHDDDSGLTSGGLTFTDLGANEVYRLYKNPGDDTDANIRVFYADTGDLKRELDTSAAIFDGSPSGDKLFFNGANSDITMPDADNLYGCFFGLVQYSMYTDASVALIDRQTLTWVWSRGMGLSFNLPKWVLCLKYTSATGVINNFAAINQQGGGGGNNIACVMNLTAAGNWDLDVGEIIVSETTAGYPERYFYRGFEFPGSTFFYEWAWDNVLYTSATHFRLREWVVNQDGLGASAVPRTVRDFVPTTDVDASLTSTFAPSLMVDNTDRTLILFWQKYPSGSTYLQKIDPIDGSTIWTSLSPKTIPGTFWPNKRQSGLNRYRWHFMSNDHLIYELDTRTGAFTQIVGVSTGFFSYGGGVWYDEEGPSLMFSSQYSETTTAIYGGTWAVAHEPTWGANDNRLWLGLDYTQDQDHRSLNADLEFIPSNIGVSFTSKGQLLRPDYGIDGGAREGPAFGKKRRNHWYAMSIDNGYNIRVGVDFTTMFPVRLATDGGTPIAEPNLFSGVRSDTLSDNYTWDGRIAWKVTRQYPCTITAVGGYISTQDK